MNLSPITIYDRPIPHKRARYTPDLLPATIYVVSRKYVITLTTPSYSPQLLLLSSGDPNHHCVMNKDEAYRGRVKRGYWSRKHDEKDATKRQGSIAPRDLIKTGKFITVMVFQY